jgi:hypothetical protein
LFIGKPERICGRGELKSKRRSKGIEGLMGKQRGLGLTPSPLFKKRLNYKKF